MQNKRVLHPFAAQEGKSLPGGLFNLEGTMISVLFKELEHKVEKLKNKKAGGHAAE